jgi:hypothetical protein
MEPRSRFAVPLEDLSATEVRPEEQVESVAQVRAVDGMPFLPHPFGDGATPDDDGD